MLITWFRKYDYKMITMTTTMTMTMTTTTTATVIIGVTPCLELIKINSN